MGVTGLRSGCRQVCPFWRLQGTVVFLPLSSLFPPHSLPGGPSFPLPSQQCSPFSWRWASCLPVLRDDSRPPAPSDSKSFTTSAKSLVLRKVPWSQTRASLGAPPAPRSVRSRDAGFAAPGCVSGRVFGLFVPRLLTRVCGEGETCLAGPSEELVTAECGPLVQCCGRTCSLASLHLSYVRL